MSCLMFASSGLRAGCKLVRPTDLSLIVLVILVGQAILTDIQMQHLSLDYNSLLGGQSSISSKVPKSSAGRPLIMVFAAASSESSTSTGFADDDEDEDEELDASASNEYPDNEEETYEDPEGSEKDTAESQGLGTWLGSELSLAKLIHNQGPRIYYHPGPQQVFSLLAGLPQARRRRRRDVEDRIVLASRRKVVRRHSKPDQEDDFQVDDGDEDAWVHDGVDDIRIDPETKQAASQLSQDEKSIDAEYEQPGSRPPNRTKVTTISEVIPITDEGDSDSSRISAQVIQPPSDMMVRPVAAAHLTREQILHLLQSALPSRPNV